MSPNLFSENYLFLVWGIIFSWLGVLTFILFLMWKRFRNSLSTKKGERWDKIWHDLRKESQENRKKILENQTGVDLLKKMSKFNIQKVGLVRFNPFSQTGGNQSFSLALLNQENQGVVISSLHSREGTRLYAKMVKMGRKKPQGKFSDEEKEAIAQAIKSFKL